MMETEELQFLIHKYYAGETNSQEETTLLRLLEDDLSGDFEDEKRQLRYFQYEQRINPQSGILFEPNIMKPKRNLKFTWIGLIAASIALVLAFFWIFAPFGEKEQLAMTSIVNDNAGEKEFTLPDGSKLWLNQNSLVQYPMNFNGNSRNIKLSGEAYFEVVFNPKQPFKVSTSNTEVEVLGTAFNVRSYPQESFISVLVNEGKVSFSSYNGQLQEKVFLTAPNEAIFDKEVNSITKYQKGDPNRLAWKTKTLEFEDAQISEVIETVNRHYNVNIYTKVDELLNCRFIGKFNNTNLEEILEVITFTMGWEVEKTEKGFQLMGQGCTVN